MRKMVETNTMGEIEVGGDHLFDQIDDLLEFPTDVVDSEVFGSVAVDYAGFPTAWSSGDLPEYSAGCCSRSTTSDISTELFVPYEDIVQLDWLSTFVEDSFSGGSSSTPEKTQVTCAENIDSFQNRFQTSSPVSVLESSSNTFSGGGRTVPVSHEKRARSKRPRPATFSPRLAIPLIAPGLPAPVTSHPIKKIKILPPASSGALHVTTQIQKQEQEQEQEQEQNINAATIRKCKHCGITKTPQWRSGPMGPKSLCNACGVRFKSGRLYPEYRPAASPTFVPSLHSNSHKKVLEMRGCN